MNNNMPNNNNSNGNDLNAVSLGTINTGNVNNIPPVPPVDNLNGVAPVQPVEPVQEQVSTPAVDTTVNPVPPVEPVTPVTPVEPVAPVGEVPSIDAMSQGTIPPVEPIPPVQPVSYDIPETINNFNTTPVFNEIGTVPPISNTPIPTPTMNTEEPKAKKKKNKLIFVIIIVLLIAAVGVGVYIFLNVSNKPAKVSVTPKEVTIEVGGEVSTNIQDYATFTGMNGSTCTLDTSAITDTSVLNAEYAFHITCGTATYDGTAKIVDTVAPSAVPKDVTAQINGQINPGDFISSCTDATECSYAFSDVEAVNGYLTSVGEHSVDIIVKDEAGNTSTVSATLIVTEDEVAEYYLSCSLNNENLRFGLTNTNEFMGSAVRTYTFTFSSSDEYNTFKTQNENQTEITYQNVTGTPSFDDATLTLTLTRKLTKAELDQEEGSTLPITYGELRQYYGGKGYSCTIEQP